MMVINNGNSKKKKVAFRLKIWKTTSFSFLIPHSFSAIPVGGGQAGALP